MKIPKSVQYAQKIRKWSYSWRYSGWIYLSYKLEPGPTKLLRARVFCLQDVSSYSIKHNYWLKWQDSIAAYENMLVRGKPVPVFPRLGENSMFELLLLTTLAENKTLSQNKNKDVKSTYKVNDIREETSKNESKYWSRLSHAGHLNKSNRTVFSRPNKPKFKFTLRLVKCWSLSSYIIGQCADDVILTQVVPDIHLSAQRSDLNDALTQEVIRLSLQTLLYPRLDVIVFVPDTHLDSVWRIVALADKKQEITLSCLRNWWATLSNVHENRM